MRDVMRIGYFGGTFDPPHLGHEILAMETICQLKLDSVKWLITPDPPHKSDREIISIDSRLEMLKLVTSKYDEFSISTVDLERSPPYYAADTARIIKEQRPDDELVYIIGEDSLRDLPGWYKPEALLAHIDQLAVAPRPGFETKLDELEDKLPGLSDKTVFLSGISMEISSSLIRRRILDGTRYEHFLSQEIVMYIRENGLYRH